MPFESFGDMFRALIGMPTRQPEPPFGSVEGVEDEESPIREDFFGRRYGRDERPQDPFDMIQEHLEEFKDMYNIFRAFGGFSDLMPIRPHFPELPERPHEDYPFHSLQQPEKSIRDEYLNPEFREDSDLDGVIAPNDFDRLTDGPKRPTHNPGNNFYGRVVITQTRVRPDGSVETHRTIKDSRSDHEESTVTVTPPNPHQTPKQPIEDFDWGKFFR